MLKKIGQQKRNYNFSSFILITFLLVMAGCKSSFLGEQEIPTVQNQPQTPPAPVVVDGMRTSYADVVEKTSPAVVMIRSERKAKSAPQQFPFADDPMFRDFFRNMPQQPNGRQQRPQIERGVGSGVIVNADGTILTNHHVIDGAEKIIVQMNNDKAFEAKIVGSDPPSDLAVLKIEGENLPFLNLGNSDNVRIGDIVLAIGNPLGIGQTVTAGIISAKGRRTGLSDGSFEDFLQTDAPINRGNSGGALINLNGELIGINSQIVSEQGGGNIGIGFSIPSNMAKSVMEQLLKDGKVHRGMLGVGIQPLTEALAEKFNVKDTNGVLINDVKKESAAEKAGIKRDDVVIAINGEKVEDPNILRNRVASTLPGTEIKVTVLRDGKEQELTAKLDELKVEGVKPDNSNEDDNNDSDNSNENGKLGLSLQPLTSQTARQLNLPPDTTGVVVTDVDPNGVAAETGIGHGDVILEINRQSVTSLEDVKSVLDKSGDKPVLLLIARKGQTIYLTVTPK
ncbi:DegQ family serine endoprotease [soil metagenome]